MANDGPANSAPVPTSTSVPLLQRVAAAEPGAAKECIARFGGLVWSLARRLTYTEAEAEDAVQEIFVELWRNAGRYDASIASETAFVAMIARRRLIDRRRKASRQIDADVLTDATPAMAPEPSPRMDVSEEVTRAAEAMSRLSVDQQKVLRLAIFQGLSHEKIARSIGLPLGTVKTHARRGLIKLRAMLDADAPAEGSAAPDVNGGMA